jgi:ribokinase
MVKIMVLASFNMDLVMRADRRPEAGETIRGEFAMHLGGKGFNQAVAARRLGAEVSVIGRVGDDEFGRMFLDALDHEGIDRRHVTVDPQEGTGVAQIVVEPDGTNTIIQAPRANLGTTAEQVGDALKDVVGAQAVLSQLEIPDPALAALFGPNTDAMRVLNAAPAVGFDHAILRQVDALIVNHIETEAIVGQPWSAADGRPDVGVRADARVIVTLAAEGSVLYGPAGDVTAQATHVAAIDTTGAGDAFCAAFVVRSLDGADKADALRFANAAGAVACTRHGAYPSMPYRHEVEALLDAQGARP